MKKTIDWKKILEHASYLALFIIIGDIIAYISGVMFRPAHSFIWLVVVVLGLWWSFRGYRREILDNEATYGKTLGVSLLLILASVIVVSVFQFLLYSMDKDLITTYLEVIEETFASSEEMLINFGMSGSDLEKATDEMYKSYEEIEANASPLFIVRSNFFSTIIGGAIIALITSIFLKRKTKKSEFDSAMQEVD